jgi:hypothetical protein
LYELARYKSGLTTNGITFFKIVQLVQRPKLGNKDIEENTERYSHKLPYNKELGLGEMNLH